MSTESGSVLLVLALGAGIFLYISTVWLPALLDRYIDDDRSKR